MIAATTAVTAYDPATGAQLTYDQWVPVSITIDSPDDPNNADVATPTSATVVLRRCRTLQSGKTDRLTDDVARRIGCGTAVVSLRVPNIYAAATDADPDPVAAAVYPAAVRAVVLGSALGPLVQAAGLLGTARGVL